MKKNFLTYSIAVALLGLGLSEAKAQQTLKIGNNPTTVTNSAVLDVEAVDKGVLLPRVALTSRNDQTTIANPADWLTVFNTATVGVGVSGLKPGYYYWNKASSIWIRLIDEPHDIKLVTTAHGTNHLSVDAGFGSAGTDPGASYGHIGIGRGALGSVTGGFETVAVGDGALFKVGTTQRDVAIGTLAMKEYTIGGYNTAIGIYAAPDYQSGVQNLFLGYEAGKGLTVGDRNIIIGRSDPLYYGGATTFSDKLYISNGNSGSTALIEGDFYNKWLKINNSLLVADLNSAATATTGNRPVVADANGQLMIGTASGGGVGAITSKNAAYTVTATDETILVDASAAAVTITLPSSPVTGQKYTVKKIDSSSNGVVVDGNGQTIDGTATITGTLPFQGWSMQYSGSAWFIISRI